MCCAADVLRPPSQAELVLLVRSVSPHGHIADVGRPLYRRRRKFQSGLCKSAEPAGSRGFRMGAHFLSAPERGFNPFEALQNFDTRRRPLLRLALLFRQSFVVVVLIQGRSRDRLGLSSVGYVRHGVTSAALAATGFASAGCLSLMDYCASRAICCYSVPSLVCGAHFRCGLFVSSLGTKAFAVAALPVEGFLHS